MGQVARLWRALVYFLSFALLMFAAMYPSVPAAAAAPVWLPAAQTPFNAGNLALGENNLGAVSGLSATLLNPAGLAAVLERELQVNRVAPLSDIVVEGVAISMPTSLGPIGVSLQQLSALGLERRDTAGNLLGLFEYMEGSLVVASAWSRPHLSVGAAVGALWQKAANMSATGVMVTTGLQWQPSASWQAGATATWAGSPGQTQYPVRLRAGVSYSWRRAALHLAWGDGRGGVGVGWQVTRELAIRAAATQVGNEWAPAAGIGLQGACAQVEYAYVGASLGEAPTQTGLGHVFSVRFQF